MKTVLNIGGHMPCAKIGSSTQWLCTCPSGLFADEIFTADDDERKDDQGMRLQCRAQQYVMETVPSNERVQRYFPTLAEAM